MQSAPQPDEVVEVFSGDTLEEAMAYAVASLGPDLTVRRARRVRKGVQGLRGKDRYEVVAVPAPRQSTDVVESAFEALLQEAEGLEEAIAPGPVRRTARAASPTTPPAVLEAVPDPEPEPLAVHHPVAVEVPVPAPAPVAVTTPAPVPAPRTARRSAPPAQRSAPPAQRSAPPARRAADAARKAPVRTATPQGWSRSALRAAGLPASVLRGLPAREPRDDLGWISALTKAFADVVPPPGRDVVVSGRGMEGVRGIVSAARSGLVPGTITYGGRTAPATATELALAVRHEVLS